MNELSTNQNKTTKPQVGSLYNSMTIKLHHAANFDENHILVHVFTSVSPNDSSNAKENLLDLLLGFLCFEKQTLDVCEHK